tara:strand:- start:1795 stop:2373 length:579 start_codon:yes stop_codon:yes gene_type:complete
MNLLYIAFSSSIAYFLTKMLYKRSNYIYISTFVACLAGLISYFSIYSDTLNSWVMSLHLYVTAMSITLLIIVTYEVFLLEWRVKKLKSGEFSNDIPFSIEKNYKTNFKLSGIGIIFLSFALISGFYITDIVSTEIQLKALYTSISWLIYCSILIGTKYFNLKTKYAVRGLIFTLMFLLIAYMGNSYIFSTIA